jgi:hypothetical protein
MTVQLTVAFRAISILTCLCCTILSSQPGLSDAADMYQAGSCQVAPRINGIDAPGEWDAAKSYDIEIAMISAQGASLPKRRCELRIMNSVEHLYLAFRVPDAARDFQLSPVVSDVVVLAFCRGEDVTAGDDRKVVLPAAYADKHVISPGKDEDDQQQDGKASMRWDKTDQGGEYFVEWQIPLAGNDPHDIVAKPGDKLRFNLVYADRFSPSTTQTEIGGIFSADGDHASQWGSLVLATAVKQETRAPVPEWLTRLFPHTGEPDQFAHRLRRLAVEEFDAGGELATSVTVELIYPGLSGEDMTAQARIYLPTALRTNPTLRLPLVHNAGYEISPAGAAKLVAEGNVVSTIHAHPLNPLGRGVHLDRAVLHAVRQLPFVDARRVSLQGGSAGGWMTLMLAADSFPLVWAAPDVPPIHWGYNADYIAKNAALATPAEGSDQPRLPVVLAVAPIADQSRKLYGVPFESEAYLASSPLAHLDTITVPTLVTFSTADMLVPIDQVASRLVQPFQPELLPDGFTTAMTDKFPGVNGQRTLLGVLPRDQYRVKDLRATDHQARLGAGDGSEGEPQNATLPFDKERVWSIVILDEGPVEPEVGHFKYAWNLDHQPFQKWAEQRGVQASQLTLSKLQRLMQRIAGVPWRPFEFRPDFEDGIQEANQLDYPAAERADVMLGLTAYSQDDDCARRLSELYSQLPNKWKVLGPKLGDGSPGSVREALK